MTRLAAIIAIALATLALPLDASAGGYDKTKWGMSVAEVQKLYPSGKPSRHPNGEAVFLLFKRVGPMAEALVMFMFDEGKLTTVHIHFPKFGTTPDLKTTNYLVMTDAQAAEAWDALRKSLGSKYGSPPVEHKTESLGGRTLSPTEAIWTTAEGDLVMLFRELLEGGQTDVTLSYSDPKWLGNRTKGL